MRRLIVMAGLLLAACAASKKVAMVHPVTYDIRWCEASMTTMFGIQANIAVGNRVKNCVEQLQALGYKKAEDLTPEEREQLLPGTKARPGKTQEF